MTRQLLRKSPRERGMAPITRALQRFEIGDRAYIIIDPAVHKGMPHRRFHGKTGVIVEKRGRAYVLRVRMGGKYKYVIARPEHLRAAP